MQHDTDWTSIKKDYEQGMTLRTLVAKYSVPKTTVIRRAQAQEWQRTTDRTIMVQGPDQPLLEPQRPPDPTTVGLAQVGIGQLATIAAVPMDLKEHTLFAQSLALYNKIIVTAPQEQTAVRGVDFSMLTQEELDIVYPIFARAEERRRIEQGETGIPQLRRNA